MFRRAMVTWLLITVVAVLNGAVRTVWITPYTGEQVGNVISVITLSCAILAVAWLAVGWIHPVTGRDGVRIGLLWLALTVAFEFGFGHYVFGAPWEKLLADYDITRGRIWVVVLAVVALAPLLAARTRGLVGTHTT